MMEILEQFRNRLLFGAGHGMRKLDVPQWIETLLLLPSLSLQKAFAARVAEIHSREANQAMSRRRLDDLFQSLLHRVFRGDL